MNSGVISMRYATALLKLVQQTGRGDAVFEQVRSLLSAPETQPAQLEPDLERFMALLVANGRTEILKQTLTSFVTLYCRAAGLKMVHLKTAVASPEFESGIVRTLERQTGCKVILSSEVDPSLIGGFTLEMDSRLLDGSVRYRLEQIRRSLVQAPVMSASNQN